MRKFLLYTLLILHICQVKLYSQQPTAWQRLSILNLPAKASVTTAGILGAQAGELLVTGGDSLVSIYQVENGVARLLHTAAFTDQVLQLACGDADNDGQNELLVVTGNNRYANNTAIRLYLVKQQAGGWLHRLLFTKTSGRPASTYLGISDADNNERNEIVMTFFESKYITETVWLKFREHTGDWKARIVARDRMAMAQDIGKFGNLPGNISVIGRPYGDSIGKAGDAYIAGSPKQPLPSFRGVKAVCLGDGDNDGINELYIGDGWHQDYGKIARGRLAVITSNSDNFRYRLIEDVKGQVEISQVMIADFDGDGKNEVLTRGNRYIRVYKYTGAAWSVYTDTALKSRPFSIGDINNDGRTDVIFAGIEGVQVYNLQKPAYTSTLGEEVITESIDPASLIDRPAPPLRVSKWLNTLPGVQPFAFGKVIILDFWATWCKPCIKMFPTLRSLQQKYGDRGFQVIGVTRIDNTQSLADIEESVRNQNLSYPIAVSEETFNYLAYGVGAIPHLVLIDRSGNIRKFEIGARDGQELEQAVKQLLEN